jgi:hypothetical protein
MRGGPILCRKYFPITLLDTSSWVPFNNHKLFNYYRKK